jgi:hypothetical protein
MRLHKDHKDWIKAVSTPENAAEWAKTDDKWVFIYEALNEVGNTYDLSTPDAVDYLVNKVEEYFDKFWPMDIILDSRN